MVRSSSLFVLLCQTAAILAAPTNSTAELNKYPPLPRIAFPDATYQAGYEPVADIYIFKNIRFAAPPVGNLRFAKPAPPSKNATLQTGSYGPSCLQANAVGINLLGGLIAKLGLARILNDMIGFHKVKGGSEDCLFLDVYVPGKAVREPGKHKLPVIHWFHGGGFILSSKDHHNSDAPIYDGSGLIGQSGNNVIYVSSNYRLGALGFLAGDTMEKTATPNAGLWDQRAALQWTRDNIAKVGGDPNQVSAMGESAGAASILHHLVAFGGKLDPLFKRAAMLSPAYLPMMDRKGRLEQIYQQFSVAAGCKNGKIECLRSASSSAIAAANLAINAKALPGTFMFGPAADGNFIRQMPSLELATGNVWKGLEGHITTHVSEEAKIFVDGSVMTDNQTARMMHKLFPDYANDNNLTQILLDRYPDMAQDASVLCNVRALAKAYPEKGYLGTYDVKPGWHGTDLVPMFWSHGLERSTMGLAFLMLFPVFRPFAEAYKSYFTSFARSGNPNEFRKQHSRMWNGKTRHWPLASGCMSDHEVAHNIMNIDFLHGYKVGNDHQISGDKCQFWRDWNSALTVKGGYSPPGAIVHSPYITEGELKNASRRY